MNAQELSPSAIAHDDAVLLRQMYTQGEAGELARSQLLARYYPAIVRRCRQVLKHDADALDAAQEAALQVHKYLHTFEGRSALETWVTAIATRQALSQLRRRRRQVQVEYVDDIATLHENVLQREVDQDGSDVEDRVQAALDALVAKSRDVIHLRFFLELSLEETSEALGISLSAAKMRLYRALDQFSSAYLNAA